jgi:hypothetical protein
VSDTRLPDGTAPETAPLARPRVSRRRLLWAASSAWVSVCFFALIPSGIAVQALAGALGRPSLATTTWFGIAVEGGVHLFLAGAFFGLMRGLRPSRRFWLVGPVGYLGSALLFGLVLYVLGDTLSVPKGAEWGFVVADALASAVGAWVGLYGVGDGRGVTGPEAGPA